MYDGDCLRGLHRRSQVGRQVTMARWGQTSWARRLGAAGILVGFVGTLALFLLHPHLREWASRVDQEVFYWGRHRHPTSGFFAVATATVLGLAGALVGYLIDRSRRTER